MQVSPRAARFENRTGRRIAARNGDENQHHRCAHQCRHDVSTASVRAAQRFWAVHCAFFCPPALAAPDEIQVYLDDVRAPGETGLELHLNYVPKGRKTPDYPGEIPPHRVFRATPEFSIGLRPNWDVGLYLPAEFAPGANAYLDGARLRLKYLAPGESTKPFFYGANLEVGQVPLRVSEDRYASELRGILGYRGGPWLFAVNPILGWALSGPDKSSTPDLTLNFKIARELNDEWSFGIEHYAGFGRINRIANSSQQDHVFYFVADFERKGFGANFGIGRGLTSASDDWVVKAILSIPVQW